MTITKDTNWRHAGAVPYDVWKKRITDAGGLSRVASKDAWEAAGDDSALMLEFLREESSYASDFAAIPASWNDPWNLQIAGVGIKFATIVDCVNAWRERMYSTTYKQGIYAKTKTIADLISVYAPKSDGNDTDGYIAGVVAGMNRNGFDTAEQEPPVAGITFGRVPHPFYQDRYIANSNAWDDLGQRGAKVVVWHRMYGTLWGTDSYFRTDAVNKALTDYGVGVSSTDGVGQAGVILRWNDPLGRRAPWASGPVNNPIGDGAKFVNIYGINAVNRDGVSIEISGTAGSTPFDAKARAAVVALTAYFADQYGKVLAAKGKKFDHTTFPIIPGEDNRSFVCYHGEFYDGKRTSCPGPVIEAATDGMLAEVKAILKQYQTAGDVVVDPPTAPVYAKPQKPAAGDSIVNDRIFLAHAQEYTAKKDVTPRIYADPGSDPTGPDIKKGAKIKTTHIVSDVGQSADLTAIIEDGSRIPVKEVLV